GYALGWALENIAHYSLAATPAQMSARRQFLVQFGGSIIGLTLGAWGIGYFLSPERSSSATAGQDLPTPAAGSTPPPPAASPFAEDASFAPPPAPRPEVTANEDFYRVDVNALPPDIDDQKWTLSVGGLVNTPLTITYADVLKMPSVQLDATLECISNDVGGSLISDTRWTGLRLRDVLNQAGLKNGVVDIKFSCADGYTESLPLASAMDERTLLTFAMNGKALERTHGFPMRVYTPNRYGMKNSKWLIGIEALGADYADGYWEVRGWDK